jgi:hypothetical protein
MNSDIRLSIEFWDHPKTIKLERRLGLEGIRSLQILWLWCRANKPKGVLTGMDAEDIEIAAKWNGEPGRFVNEALTVRWLDVNGNIYELHDWQDHNPWSCDSESRSNKARFSRMAKTHPGLFKNLKEGGVTELSLTEYRELITENNDSLTVVNASLTPAPAPAPAPIALSIPVGKRTDKDRRKSFKQWSKEELVVSVGEANTDSFFTSEEVEDFVEYWMEQSASGKSRLSMEKTWDTRRRMKTAFKLIYESRREKQFKAAPQQMKTIGGYT